MKKMKITLPLMIFALLLAACGGNESETAVEPSTSDTAQTTSTNEEMADDSAMTEPEETMDETEAAQSDSEDMSEEAVLDEMNSAGAPAWMNEVLTDVRSGEPFALADFAGKTVFVEPMATWCANCRRQLMNVTQAIAQLGDNEDVVFVALSVETNITDEDLFNYTEQTGYHFTFAVATPEMVVSLVDTFGQSITNPPSTPHFIIRPDGSTTELTTGFEGPDDIIENIMAESQS